MGLPTSSPAEIKKEIFKYTLALVTYLLSEPLLTQDTTPKKNLSHIQSRLKTIYLRGLLLNFQESLSTPALQTNYLDTLRHAGKLTYGMQCIIKN